MDQREPEVTRALLRRALRNLLGEMAPEVPLPEGVRRTPPRVAQGTEAGQSRAVEAAHVNRIADVIEQNGGEFGGGLRLVVAGRRNGIDSNYPFLHIMKNGERIGDVGLGSVNGAELRLSPRLSAPYRKQNIGTQLYQYMERLDGRPLGRSDNLTEAGAGLWRRLDLRRALRAALFGGDDG